MKTPSPKLTPVKLSGGEPFTSQSKPFGFSVNDFWSWAVSDLASNSTRGVLAEFIVAKALGLELSLRDEWGNYDLQYGAIKIEVKSSAYIQTWQQKQYSSPCFDIGLRITQVDEVSGDRVVLQEPVRPADVYIFAFLKGEITKTDEPLCLDHWEFYIIDNKTLHERFQHLKSLTISKLRSVVSPESFEGLLKAFLNKIEK